MKTNKQLLVAAIAAASLGFACAEGGLVEVPVDAALLEGDQVETLIAMSWSGVDEAGRWAITNQEDWAEFWTRAHSPYAPQPDVPEVDFEQRVVVAAAMGTKPTGGYSIQVESVHRDNGDLYVTVLERRPGAGCIVTQALTAPVTALSVPRLDGDVKFVERDEIMDC